MMEAGRQDIGSNLASLRPHCLRPGMETAVVLKVVGQCLHYEDLRSGADIPRPLAAYVMLPSLGEKFTR